MGRSRIQNIATWLNQPTSIAPLVTFRVLFGAVMVISLIRFYMNGWIKEFYLDPSFHFKFYGFYWVEVPDSPFILYGLYILMLLSAIGITFGFLYRLSAAIFFLLFSYFELLDATYYLNHYYFISLMAFLMMWFPANKYFSIDSKIWPEIKSNSVSRWPIFIIQFQLGIVYFMAGVAKLNYDWLVNAMPLKIWLPAKSNIPVIGNVLKYTATAYFFSWFGALYDLFIPFALSFRKTRKLAYVAVIAFHVCTAALFQIGMFPYIMILLTLIFFPASFHEKLLGIKKLHNIILKTNKTSLKPLVIGLFSAYFLFQLIFPFRYALYDGKLFWTEQGYRFSWRVMLMEKAGYATFYVHDESTGKYSVVNNSEFLTPFQEKMMATQPDFIIQYANYLKEYYQTHTKTIEPKITADIYVTLNGRRSKVFIDPEIDLSELKDSWEPKSWVLPYKNDRVDEKG
ncbi:HTTM domain-containing protein [Marinigracilibium pacificum]|uniref:HTTM domain-containing protein n=1 Tax=Marinigracilibium pacificum TaxID=2729599 RepID=A0A848IUW1_9BACT|nr:HTTM domain-containing protein [Marinigracilibium pacificum]NMM46978.1 HTTM domain-containing protein [Marinigracilibium pacificum]